MMKSEAFRNTACTQGFLLACFIFILLPSSLCAQSVPASTILEARLSTPAGSRLSQTGDRVEATTIAPIGARGQILVPQGSTLFGSIESVTPFGFGLREVTATIHFQFHTLRLPDGATIPIQTEVLEVDTAKERVDVDGTVRGIHPAVSVSASLALFTVPLLFVAPAVGVPVWAVKSVVAPPADPEIYFPSGTELLLRLTAPFDVRSSDRRPVSTASLSPEDESEVRRLLQGSAQRARMGTSPSDFINLLFLADRKDMDSAFHAAGWVQAERKSPMSLYRMYHALAKRIGYKAAPMNALTLNGMPSDFVYQKSLNTVQKRHHIRLWQDPQRADVWRGAAAEDIAFRFELAHWTHSTAPNIDRERTKVVDDLAFTRCLDAAALMKRDSPDLLQDPKAKRLIVTDADIAVVRLNHCNNPEIMPGVVGNPSMAPRSRVSRLWTSFRNDLRLNIFFTTYNTLKLVTKRNDLKPLRKASDIDAGLPGLDWLSDSARSWTPTAR
jgi:hypothetical protein